MLVKRMARWKKCEYIKELLLYQKKKNYYMRGDLFYIGVINTNQWLV
jgi:hypothetical protein